MNKMKKQVFLLCFIIFSGSLIARRSYAGQIKTNLINMKQKESGQLINTNTVVQVGNSIIKVQANTNGNFNIGTADDITLTYNFPKEPVTSHTNFFVDGYISGNNINITYDENIDVIEPAYIVGNSIYHTWKIENIVITQKLIPVSSNDSTGAILIKYTLKNHDTHSHELGILLQLDTMIDDNDAAPLFNRNNYCNVETMFTGIDVPDYYQAWQRNNINDPGLIAQGILRGGIAVCPDIFMIGDWTNFYFVKWDYAVTGTNYGDSAVILRWNPKSVVPGDSLVVATYYGLGDVVTSSGDLSLALTLPQSIIVQDDKLVPNPFDVNLLVLNQGFATAENVQARIILPPFLSLVSGVNVVQDVSPLNIQSGNNGTATWRVLASIPPQDTCVNIKVSVFSSNTDSNSVSGQICLPSIIVNWSDTVRIYPKTDTLDHYAGDKFWLKICIGDLIQPVHELHDISFILSYDTTCMDVVQPLSMYVIPGDLWNKRANVQINATQLSNDSLLCMIQHVYPDSGANGEGTLLKIKFQLDQQIQDTTCCFAIHSASASDCNEASIWLIPEKEYISVIGPLIVWPGDTDNNGFVNQADLLPIGACWNETGYPRTGYANLVNWEPQYCHQWTQGEHYTYADANGDSVVGQNDILVLDLNWHKKRGLSKSCSGSLVLSSTGTFKPIILEDSEDIMVIGCEVEGVENLLGVGFEMDYASSGIEVVSVRKGDFLGEEAFLFHHNEPDKEKLGIAVTRYREQGGVSGKGCVIRIRMKLKVETNLSAIVFNRVTGMDVQGNQFELEKDSLDLMSSLSEHRNNPESFVLHQNYPNPFNSSTRIRYFIPESGKVEIKIYNTLGHELAVLVNEYHERGDYIYDWYGKDENQQSLSSGLYLCRMDGYQSTEIIKIILVR